MTPKLWLNNSVDVSLTMLHHEYLSSMPFTLLQEDFFRKIIDPWGGAILTKGP